MVESLSLEYRTQLAMTKEEAGEVKVAVFLRHMNSIEAQHRLFCSILTVENTIRGGSITQVTITKKHGKFVEYTEMKDIEKLIAKPTENKWHKTKGGSELIKE